MLAANLAAPVLFQDAEAAEGILQTLAVRNDVECAQVIDHLGQGFTGTRHHIVRANRHQRGSLKRRDLLARNGFADLAHAHGQSFEITVRLLREGPKGSRRRIDDIVNAGGQ